MSKERERECVCSKIMYTVTPKFTQNSNDDMLPWYLQGFLAYSSAGRAGHTPQPLPQSGTVKKKKKKKYIYFLFQLTHINANIHRDKLKQII